MDSNPREGRLPESLSAWTAIGVSWMAIRWPVKIWLFFLNAVFLAAFLFWPRPLTKWILLAYLASAPLLLLFMVFQRGLTRLLGVAHLIPWIPLVLYLSVRLTTDTLGPRIVYTHSPYRFTYVVCLLGTVGVCLLLDVRDLVRWIRGERYVLGSKKAVESGASYDARRWFERD